MLQAQSSYTLFGPSRLGQRGKSLGTDLVFDKESGSVGKSIVSCCLFFRLGPWFSSARLAGSALDEGLGKLR